MTLSEPPVATRTIFEWLQRERTAAEHAFDKALAIKGKDHHHLDYFAVRIRVIEELTADLSRMGQQP